MSKGQFLDKIKWDISRSNFGRGGRGRDLETGKGRRKRGDVPEKEGRRETARWKNGSYRVK
jgi:hypothetical protein